MRHASNELPALVGYFPDAESVTVDIYNLSDDSKVVDAGICTKVGSTGVYKYRPSFSVSTFSEFVWVMSDGIDHAWGTFDIGGYPDHLNADISTRAVPGDEMKLAEDAIGEIDEQLSSVHGSGTWEPDISGSKMYTDKFEDLNHNPLESVQVEAYSDSDRSTSSLVDVETTDVNGVFIFHLNPGTYYMRATKVGYTFSDWVKVIAA